MWEANPENREWALEYCGFDGDNWAEGGFESGSCRAFVKTLWQSPADSVIVPIQDLCGFGSDTKMNLPGIPYGNWGFRITSEQLNSVDKKWLRKLSETYKRI